ncbi:DUF3892 domain-containing protein [Mucilaginibacter paludis]|uniref:DUF3892 domain-containing protein n=1 Tax=Mucilaginibacter paludis DSM 18603 TaxID=714943 RepID=H1Y8H7_9SPHI|nr:DUF3892 domain-containing protein [Mucilaginibacter paludis]EHQ25895.1 hypothetical protein Mucpa_1741 [Mucilaginibacter paludis DSM 18603]
MATKRQVSCINKRGSHYSAHERISHIGGINHDNTRWKLTEDQAIKDIENKQYEFYVLVNGRSSDVIVASYQGCKYLRTIADGYSPDNLLSLPECP